MYFVLFWIRRECAVEVIWPAFPGSDCSSEADKSLSLAKQHQGIASCLTSANPQKACLFNSLLFSLRFFSSFRVYIGLRSSLQGETSDLQAKFWTNPKELIFPHFVVVFLRKLLALLFRVKIIWWLIWSGPGMCLWTFPLKKADFGARIQLSGVQMFVAI